MVFLFWYCEIVCELWYYAHLHTNELIWNKSVYVNCKHANAICAHLRAMQCKMQLPISLGCDHFKINIQIQFEIQNLCIFHCLIASRLFPQFIKNKASAVIIPTKMNSFEKLRRNEDEEEKNSRQEFTFRWLAKWNKSVDIQFISLSLSRFNFKIKIKNMEWLQLLLAFLFASITTVCVCVCQSNHPCTRCMLLTSLTPAIPHGNHTIVSIFTFHQEGNSSPPPNCTLL